MAEVGSATAAGGGAPFDGARRPSAAAFPPSWVRPAEDLVDPVVAADRTWVVAILLGLLVCSVFLLLIQHAGAEGFTTAEPSSPAPAPVSSPAPSSLPSPSSPSPGALTTPTPALASPALPSPALASPAATAPEDDDRVEPDPPPR